VFKGVANLSNKDLAGTADAYAGEVSNAGTIPDHPIQIIVVSPGFN
jgi:hypothetical protein